MLGLCYTLSLSLSLSIYVYISCSWMLGSAPYPQRFSRRLSGLKDGALYPQYIYFLNWRLSGLKDGTDMHASGLTVWANSWTSCSQWSPLLVMLSSQCVLSRSKRVKIHCASFDYCRSQTWAHSRILRTIEIAVHPIKERELAFLNSIDKPRKKRQNEQHWSFCGP